jgi:pimeloyl-ACP methyl ester carboxylesterase
VSIGYQVVGNGPVDLLFVPFLINLIWAWEQPIFVDFVDRMKAFSRLILFDKRGTGLSDRPRDLPTLETRMDDIRAVLDAVGSARAVLFGLGDASPLSVLFAATYPERTAGLILMNASPRFVKSPSCSGLAFEERGEHELKGIPGEWRLYAVKR